MAQPYRFENGTPYVPPPAPPLVPEHEGLVHKLDEHPIAHGVVSDGGPVLALDGDAALASSSDSARP
jgi:hypothetical protein